ncbi:iron complex transport system ATP-binding protein [Algoriella xinjiangensis]|uniref:Iron complex transport system ATP-binding protein n=1 Tax=Algoriella xinjiangensis TaxID=684065 RepID=A0A1I4YZP7_9FLAO|nr:ABC transporter ATP-binding protein [Algoriella xinjiangensis]SFN43159.1 iron complex transport system ATP-binding protein [Algoriella xinjiangensis]VDH16637.1 Probable siderophore transport system ATP-binding protein YusV [Algoriella xinjiangensis]
MNTEILRLENVTVGYGSQKIVSSINASISENELVAVLGKNGVGKSTLINSILGFQKILNGSILIENQSIQKLSAQEIAQEIAVVLPRLSIVPKIKVSELVAMGRLPYHKVLKKISNEELSLVDEVLEMVGIYDLKTHYANQISEGQLQLVMIARALCQDSKLVILDEPTSNLDLANQYKIFNLLNEIKSKTNKSFLMITHNVDFAIEKSDKIWWIENNELKENIPEQAAFEFQIMQKLSNQNLSYDSDTNRFLTKKNFRKSIGVKGNSELAFWVKNALMRNGIQVENNAENHIEITENNIIFGNQKFENIQAIINFIQQNEKYNHNRSE